MSFFRRRRKEKDEPAKPATTSRAPVKSPRPAGPSPPSKEKLTEAPSTPMSSPPTPVVTAVASTPSPSAVDHPRSPPPRSPTEQHR